MNNKAILDNEGDVIVIYDNRLYTVLGISNTVSSRPCNCTSGLGHYDLLCFTNCRDVCYGACQNEFRPATIIEYMRLMRNRNE